MRSGRTFSFLAPLPTLLRMSLYSTVAGNILWNALSTIGGLLFGLVTSIVLARTLGPTVIGQYHYWIWVTTLLVLIASPGPAHAMTRFGAEFLGKQERPTATTLFVWLLLAELALGGLVCVAALLFAWRAQATDPLALALVAIAVLPAVVERLFLAAAKATQEFRFLSQASLAGNLFYAVFAIAAVSLGYGIYALLLIATARRIVTLSLIGWKLPTHYSVRDAFRFSPGNGAAPWGLAAIPPELRRRLLLYCRDITLILVIDAVLYERSELFFLKRFSTDADVAFYSQSFDLALKAMAIPAIFSGVLLPTFSSLAGQRDWDRFNALHTSSYRILALVAMPIGLGGAAIAPAFVLLFGLEFLPMSPVLAILLVGNIVGALATVSSTILHSMEEQNFIVRLGFLVAILNIALDLLLIPNYGATGAAFANSGSQLVSGVVGITYSTRRLNLSLPLRSLVRIAMAALSAAAIAWLITASLGGLVLAIAAAILVYPVMLRLFVALEASDYDLLTRATAYLPETVTPAYQTLISFLVPKQGS